MAHDGTRAFWIVAEGRGEIREEPLRPPRDGEVLIQTLFSGVSRGTESLVFRGRVPVSEYARMRGPHQAGDFPFPVKYGYSSVGRVVDGPADALGMLVFCLHPHQTKYVVPAREAHPLPSTVPPERAVLAANLETALNAVWDAEPSVGDQVAVVGAGAVGSLVAHVASGSKGTRVTLVDVEPSRAAIAERLGVAFETPDRAPDDCDIVFHASGSPAGLRRALELAGHEGTVVELSWYGDRAVELPLGAAFHSKRLRLVSSQVSSVSPRRRGRWSPGRRLELALELLADERLDALITAESRFEELPETMALLAVDGAPGGCHRIRYTD